MAYVSGVDGRLDLKTIIDELPPKSILFIDEADKCLDSNAQMVSSAEAVQLQHSIVTHFNRKPIYWAFLGTFTAMRGNNKISYNLLEKTLGKELASRLDFADWEFPDWTADTLLRAVTPLLNKRGLSYADDAVLVILDYCLKTGGGIRAFDNIDQALKRRCSSTPSTQNKVSVDMARSYLSNLGFREAA